MIRLGVIGAGNIGSVHIGTFKNLPEVEIVAVTDAFLQLAERKAGEHGIKKVHANSDELINDPEIDAVVICVSNEWHAPIAIKALQAGKHVLLEKPMAINIDAARDIVRAQRESGKVLMLSHQMRWEWIALQMKEQIEKGALGDIYNVKTGWMRRKGIPGWGTWFTQMNKSGGGPLIDIGVHMLDLSLHLMGGAKPVSVYGSTYAEFGPKRKGIGTWGTPDWNGLYDVEDLATAIIKMDNGATLSLDVSWAAHMETDSKPYVHLLGTEGGANIRGTSGTLLTEMYDRTVDVPVNPPEKDEGARIRMSRHFVDCVLNGIEPITSVMTGFTNNLILDAIYQSSKTGHEVKLNWEI